MGSLRRRFEFAARACIPLCGALLPRRGRSTHTHGHKPFGSPACGAKNSHRFANVSPPLPERHEGFAWTSLSRAKSKGLSRQKGFIVCVCPTPAMQARRGGRVCGSVANLFLTIRGKFCLTYAFVCINVQLWKRKRLT
jgi:hypothetical protein